MRQIEHVVSSSLAGSSSSSSAADSSEARREWGRGVSDPASIPSRTWMIPLLLLLSLDESSVSSAGATMDLLERDGGVDSQCVVVTWDSWWLRSSLAENASVDERAARAAAYAAMERRDESLFLEDAL